ncbi:MAG: ATP-binding cassette domain-containing protein [Deltaproteobacteria bacterium]|nr:ATP-binding cassette domain-containing protein [Deltaproteobacteria bacterium]
MSAPLFHIAHLAWSVSPDFRLDIPDLVLPAGRTTAILGRSASGKSTLLSLLGRVEGSYFERPAGLSGSIHMHAHDGRPAVDLLSLSERELLQQRVRGLTLGFVFQREGLFPERDATDNIAWPLRGFGLAASEAARRASEALAAVGLAPDRKVATLSGGERKRLALARAIAPRPRVLLLDEPLTGLDPEALGGLRELLARIAREPTAPGEPARSLVMVTHQREDVLELADHLVFMDRGRVALAGPRTELARELDAFFAGVVPTARDPHAAAPARSNGKEI